MLFRLFKNPLNRINMIYIIGIDENIIEIHNNKNIQFLSQDLIDITLKTSSNVEQAKQYDLLFAITIFSLKLYFPFISLSNLYLIVLSN